MDLVSIVVPTLNEELTEPLATLGTYLGGLAGRRFEIIVVDDSPDGPREKARQAVHAAVLPANVVARFVDGPRSGKGASVRLGIGATKGDCIFVMDVDMPAPMSCIEDFVEIIDQGADAVIAERVLNRPFSSPLRWVVSRGLLVIQRVLVFHSSEFSDTQCGFKAFRGALLRDIAAQQIVDGGMYDLEYLYVAVLRKQRIRKVQIVPNAERRESRIRVWKCLRRDPVDVIRVKAHAFLGRYR